MYVTNLSNLYQSTHFISLFYRFFILNNPFKVDVFSQRIADKIAENCIGGRAVLVTVDNRRLSLILESHSLIVQQWSSSAGAATVTEKGRLLFRNLLKYIIEYVFTNSNSKLITNSNVYFKLIQVPNFFENSL